MRRRNFLLLAGGAVTTAALSPYIKTLDFRPEPVFAAVVKPNTKLTSDAIKWKVSFALAQTVAQCEGAWWPGRDVDETYRTLFGGSLFDSYKDHPDKVIHDPTSGYSSAAAGAYQFMPDTWFALVARYKNWYSGDKFSPVNQDLGFRRLFTEIGAYALLEKGITVTNQVITVKPEAVKASIERAASTWCSLPGSNRGACGGVQIGNTWYPAQPYRSWDEVIGWFETSLKTQQGI